MSQLGQVIDRLKDLQLSAQYVRSGAVKVTMSQQHLEAIDEAVALLISFASRETGGNQTATEVSVATSASAALSSSPNSSPLSRVDAAKEAEQGEWQPIVVAAAPGEAIPARAAWLYEKSCGVRLGTFGRFADGCAFATVSGLSGCFIREWGATHFKWAQIPQPPKGESDAI